MSKNNITGDTLASKVGDKTAYQNYCESWDRIWAKRKEKDSLTELFEVVDSLKDNGITVAY